MVRVWTREDPGVGDPGAFRVAAARLGADIDVLERVHVVLVRQGGILELEWKGLAAKAWQVVLASMRAYALAMIESGTVARQGYLRYAADVEDVQQRVAVVHHQMADAEANLSVITRYAEAEAGSGVYQMLLVRCEQAAQEVELARGLLEPLVVAREEADRRLEMALQEAGTAPPEVSATAQAMVAVLVSDQPPPEAQRFLNYPTNQSPFNVKERWEALSAADQQWLMTYRPFRIGNLDGLPAWVRNLANRSEVERYGARLDEGWVRARKEYPDASDYQRQWVAWKYAGLSEEEARSVANLRRELRKRPEAQLLVFDMKHEGATRAAVSIGDLDNASHVGVFVPGIGSRIGNSGNVKMYLDHMKNLRTETGKVLQKDLQGAKEDVACVYWLGYSPPSGLEGGPSVTTALKEGRAADGGRSLANFADGIEVNNPGSRRSLLGHSYGSVTSAHALVRTDSFDSFVAFGSPGIPDGVSDVRVPAGERYYGVARGDLVAGVGPYVHGNKPSELGFERLPTRKVDGYDNSTGHSQYLKDGSSFQRSLAAVVAGRPEEVPG